MRSTKLPKLLWIILGLIFLLDIVTIFIALRSPSSHSYPSQKPIVISLDYNKINALVQADLNALPQAQNGVNGTNGINGKDGAQGPSGVAGPTGATGETGQTGSPGDSGAPARQVELRYNAVKNQVEWHYDGDISWNTLVSACTLTNTCGAQ